MFDRFFQMSLYLDPIGKSGWPQSWTVFFWAWWLGYLPVMSSFYAYISRGRTLRQILLGVLGWGTLGTTFFMGIQGTYVLHVQKQGILDAISVLKEHGAEEMVLQVMRTLPGGEIVAIIFILLAFLFVATLMDSCAYMLAFLTCKNMKYGDEPPRYLRLLWAGLLGFVGLSLMAVNALKAVQVSSLLAAVPLLPIGVILLKSFFKYANEDFPELKSTPVTKD